LDTTFREVVSVSHENNGGNAEEKLGSRHFHFQRIWLAPAEMIAHGMTKTAQQFFETIRPTSLLKRFESTEEGVSVVAFVASTQAVAINCGARGRRRHSQNSLASTTASLHRSQSAARRADPR
jgi:hypothetical protein